MKYIQLFLSFAQIGLFSIGGGYAAMPLIQNQAVKVHNWLTMSEFTDLVTIAEMTPGPIAINSATFVGIRVGGLFGAIIATFGCVFPSCLIVSLISSLYYRYRESDTMKTVLSSLRPAVAALIAAAGLSILITVAFGGGEIAIKDTNIFGIATFVIAFLILRRNKKNPIFIIVACGISHLCLSFVLPK